MWKRIIVFFVALLILFRQIIPISQLIRDFPLNDFSVYLDGARTTIEGKNPYTIKFFDRYNYPPAATIFFISLNKIDVNVAEFIFTMLSIISLWLIVSMSLSASKTNVHWTTRLLLFSLVLKSFPIKLTLVLGQINLIILFLAIGSWFMEQKRKDVIPRLTRLAEVPAKLARNLYRYRFPTRFAESRRVESGMTMISGILLGLATAIKLTPGPLILYFLVRRKIKFAIGWLGVFGGLGILGIVQFGWEQTGYFYFMHLPKLLSETTPDTLNLTYMNQSLLAMLGRLGIFGELGAAIRYGVVAVILIGIVRSLKRYHSGASLRATRLQLPSATANGGQVESHRSYRPALSKASTESAGLQDDPRMNFQLYSAFLIVVFLLLPSFVWQHHFVALVPAWIVFVSRAVKKPRSLWTLAAILGYVLLNVSMKDPYLPSRLHPLLASHFTLTAFFFLTLLIFPRPHAQKQ